jgi:hypothetical protein
MNYVPHFITVFQTYSYTNKEKNTSYAIDVQHGVCMCPYYQKHVYCKHLIHAHGHTHTHSDKIMLEHKFSF